VPRVGDERDLPLTRASGMAPLVAFLDSLGAPTTRLLQKAGLPPSLLEEGEALVPLRLVQRMVEVAARWADIDNLGVVVGQHVCAFDLGAYGQLLRRTVTVYDYLQTGAKLIGSVTSGERFWLTQEGDRVRFHHLQPGHPGAGRFQSDLYAVVVTINTMRRFLGQDWTPEEVCLMAPDAEMVGDGAVFGNTDVHLNQSHSSFTMPLSTLHRPVPPAMHDPGASPATRAALKPEMPSDFQESVELLVAELLLSGCLDIHVVTEAAGMSTRTFQRRLQSSGLSYSDVVQRTRVRLASEWLTGSGAAISEIAAVLGYDDPAHFSRAFRNKAGLSPQQYRNQHR